MHTSITKTFKNYYMFGFTGTPIFEENASNDFQTTDKIFGARLHTYTIIDAIRDENVLKFKVDYMSTAKRIGVANPAMDVAEETNFELQDNDKFLRSKAVLFHPNRINGIVNYILEHFSQKTNKRMFNAMLATHNIEAAKLYYKVFRKKDHDLKIATVFSYNPNEEINELKTDGVENENNESVSKLDKSSRAFLDQAIADYNNMFDSNYSTASFGDYYKDITERVKSREIDLIIIANMLLTGFDAPALNTLFVDKNLKQHGLIQAFSRTNRKLDANKSHGNIVTFRNLDKQVDEALALFGDKEKAISHVLLKPYADLIDEYQESVEQLKSLPDELERESEQKDFVKVFGVILKERNVLNSFDEFIDDETMTEREFQDFSSVYLDLKDKFKKKRKENPEDDAFDEIVFEVDLIKANEINVDYILDLLEKHENFAEICPLIRSSEILRTKEDLLEKFYQDYDKQENIHTAWHEFINGEKQVELANIIKEENLNAELAQQLMDNAFRNGQLNETGTGLSRILPKMSRFGGNRDVKKHKVLDKLKTYFERFTGI